MIRPMKITAIESFVLTVPARKPIALEFPHHRLVVATIATDEGISGLGYSSPSAAGAPRPSRPT